MKQLLREPLVHFLLGGAVLFLAYGLVAEPETGRGDEIVVSQDRVAMLAQSFERTWMRPPTGAELDGLIDDYVVEEVLYREALLLGLDRDDLMVRRRMRQKMEFLHDGLVAVEPSDEELRAFLEENPEKFRVPARVDLEQVFVKPSPRDAAEARASALLERLRRGEAAAPLGDPTLLPSELVRATPAELAGTFGADFAAALAGLPEGEWSGPIASGFGLHLVLVRFREPGRIPDLEEARAALEREWGALQRAEARRRFTRALRDRYRVRVERPAREVGPEVAAQP